MFKSDFEESNEDPIVFGILSSMNPGHRDQFLNWREAHARGRAVWALVLGVLGTFLVTSGFWWGATSLKTEYLEESRQVSEARLEEYMRHLQDCDADRSAYRYAYAQLTAQCEASSAVAP